MVQPDRIGDADQRDSRRGVGGEHAVHVDAGGTQVRERLRREGVGAYGAFAYCVRELGPSVTSVSMYLGPLYVGILAWLTLGEAPQWYHLMGTLLVLPGLFLATRSAPKGA